MPEQMNKERTKDANQEPIPELPEGQLDQVVGGNRLRATKFHDRLLGQGGGEEKD